MPLRPDRTPVVWWLAVAGTASVVAGVLEDYHRVVSVGIVAGVGCWLLAIVYALLAERQ